MRELDLALLGHIPTDNSEANLKLCYDAQAETLQRLYTFNYNHRIEIGASSQNLAGKQRKGQ